MSVPPPAPVSEAPEGTAPRRRRDDFDPVPRLLFLLVVVLFGLLVIAVAYLLRGVLAPLFFAFLVAYALDPAVGRLERSGVPRGVGAALIMTAIASGFVLVVIYAVPMFADQVRATATELPAKLLGLEARLDPWLFQLLGLHVPHTMSELVGTFGGKLQEALPTTLNAVALALFGTLSYLAVALSALIVPVFALYLLVDFDRIVSQSAKLVPRRWQAETRDVAGEIHRTLGSYVRGQLTANVVLGALYATGLRLVDVRFAVAIGILTGMLAFVPYVGFATGLFLALAMAALDWRGVGTLAEVMVVMGIVQLVDGLVVTPRIVGRSVGLAPIEVILTMMAAASIFGFFGVLLAVPLGAVGKIVARRAVRRYLRSAFYFARA
jgi:predicted PurR-regulated permease PerM